MPGLVTRAEPLPTFVPRDARVPDVVARVRERVADAVCGHAAVVLAVSGGRDSVVLLDAALAVARQHVRLVATFDHGTGDAATLAADHVRALAAAAGVPVHARRAAAAGATEAEWRAARWRFLGGARRVAGRGAVVATGHTRDDQLETVILRLLRGAGVRGLAGMYAPRAGVVRPLLAVPGADVRAYATVRALAWVDDPSNASRRHLRNRVRHELLPALLAARPSLGGELLALADDAARCRTELDALAATLGAECAASSGAAASGGGEPVARLAALAGMSPDALAELWPALAARAGARLDRRGTRRLADHTRGALAAVAAGRRPLSRATVAGGVEVAVEARGDRGSPEWVMVVRVAAAQHVSRGGAVDAPISLDGGPAAGPSALGPWSVRVLARAPTRAELEGGAVAWLAAGRRYVVRAWRPGDRWQPAPGATARRVKRFLADRRVPALARAGWPVVAVAPIADAGAAARGAAEGEIVWVPGVRRSSAAPVRPGQPGFYLLCERTPERRRPPGR